MRSLLLIKFMLVCFFIYGQEAIYVKEKKYEGYIFAKEHFVFHSIEGQKDRYTPSLKEIQLAESILADSIDKFISRKQPFRCSSNSIVSEKTLKKYRRQYIGFLTINNEVVIWINMLRNKDISNDELSSDIVQVFDGGAYYWNIYINITRRELLNMFVNGES